MARLTHQLDEMVRAWNYIVGGVIGIGVVALWSLVYYMTR